MKIFDSLQSALQKNSVTSDIVLMQNYMKNNFAFYGVRSPLRKSIFKYVLKQHNIPSKENYKEEVLKMMAFPKREMNYCAIDLAIKCQKKYSAIQDINYITKLLTTNSWWDSIDNIAPNVLGKFLQDFPNEINIVLKEYKDSNNFWLHRSCILFQLKYKEKTNKELLFEICKQFSKSETFFIQKAIGWALREYAKTNPNDVYYFVDSFSLAKLSIKEANKHKSE